MIAVQREVLKQTVTRWVSVVANNFNTVGVGRLVNGRSGHAVAAHRGALKRVCAAVHGERQRRRDLVSACWQVNAAAVLVSQVNRRLDGGRVVCRAVAGSAKIFDRHQVLHLVVQSLADRARHDAQGVSLLEADQSVAQCNIGLIG